jgi:ABC-type nitrate/sulfonate/bicarbonate transport system substrate-binding protein
LRRAGLDPNKDVQIVSVGFSPQRAAALSKDLIQGAPLVPQVALEAQKLGLKMIKTKEIPFITSMLMTTKSFIRKDEEVIRNFMKGYVTSIHYYLSHREESIGIMDKFVAAVDSSALEVMYNGFAAQLTPYLDTDKEALQAILDAASVVDEKAGVLKKTDLFDLRFIGEIKASGFVEELYGEKVDL